MATISWNAAGSPGDWGVAANWPGNIKPQATDTVSLAATRPTTITIGPSDIVTVAAIIAGTGANDTITIAGGSLAITGNAAIGSALAITAGKLNLGVATVLSGNAGALLTNAGTISKAAGTGTATVSVATVNTGMISVAAGTLSFTAAVTQNGNLGAADGTTLSLAGGGTLGGSVSTLGSGLIAFGGNWTMSANALSLTGNLGFSGSLTLTAGQTLTLASSTTFGATLNGGKLITLGPVTVNGGNLTGGAIWSASAALTFAQNAVVTLNAGALTINSAGSAALNDGSAITSSTGTDALTNAGQITKSAGIANAVITAAVTNTGTINATSGQIQLNGTLVNSGTLSAIGATIVATGPVTETGTLSAGDGGSVQLTGGGTLGGTISTSGSGQIALLGGWTLTPQTLAWNGAVSVGGTITFTSGQSLSLAGPVAWSGSIYGPGTLSTSGPVSVQSGGVYTGATWSDSGAMTFAKNANLVLDAGSLAVSAAGSIALDDGSQISAITGTEQIANAGTITKATGTGIALIGGQIGNTGTIRVTSGTLNLSGSVANAGSIAVAGATLGLGTFSGAGTIAATSGATLNLNGGGTLSVRLTGDATSTANLDGGNFTQSDAALDWTFLANLAAGSLQFTSGQSLTLHKVGTIGGFVLGGAGTLDTTGALSENGFAVGNGATWQIDGAVTQSGNALQLGAASAAGATAGTLSIGKAGSFSLANDNGVIATAAGLATTGPGAITNAGTLAKTAGTGTSHIAEATTSTGTIAVQTGTLAFDAAITTSGALTIAAGAALQFNAGGTLGGTLANASSRQLLLGAGRFALSQSGLVWNGVNLAATLAFASGQTFTLGGTDTISGEVNGAGTLVLQGTTTATDGMTVDDGATASVTGQMTFANGTIWLDSIGSALSGTAAGAGTLTVAKGGTLTLGSGTVTLGQHTVAGQFNVAGTLTVNGSTALNLAVNTHNTGNFNVSGTTLVSSGAFTNDGSLTLATTTATFSGAFNQTGALSIGDKSSATLSGGGTLGGTLATTGSGILHLAQGSNFTLGTPATTWAGTLDDKAGIALTTGQTLSLGGNDTLAGTFSGPGTVTVSGQANANGGALLNGVTMNVAGALSLSASTLRLEATLAVLAGGTMTLTGNAKIAPLLGTGTVRNAGTITGGSDGSAIEIDDDVVNTGSINATGGGALYLYGTTTNTGTITANGGNMIIQSITGHGTVAVDGTSRITINGGNVFDQTYQVASGAFLAFGNGITLSTPTASFAQVFTLLGTVNFTTGQTLTLTGADQLAQGGLTGSGTLITTAAITETGLSFGSGATWDIRGSVSHSGFSVTGTDGTVLIEAGASFALTDDSGIQINGNANVQVAGALTKSGGTGLSYVSGAVTDTGTIAVKTGTIGFNGTLAGGGALTIAAGAGASFNSTGAAATNFAGTITNAGAIAWFTVTNGTFSGAIANTGSIDVGNSALKLSGAITGTGTLAIEAGATLELGQAPAAGQTIQFKGNGTGPFGSSGAAPGAHLVLDTLGSATISGVANADTIDFAGATIQSAVISGNTLTVTTTGGQTATFTSATSLNGLATSITGDGKTGSIVTFNSNVPAVAQLQQTSYSYTLTPTNQAGFYLDLTNAAPSGSGAALNATILSTTGPVVATGSVTGLGAGNSDGSDLHLQIDPTAPGPFTATVTLGFSSAGNPAVTLPSQTVTITGTVVADAVAKWSAPAGYTITGNATNGYVLDLGAQPLGYAAFALPIEVINAALGNSATLGGYLNVSGGLLTMGSATGTLPSGVAADVPFTVNSLGIGAQVETLTFTPTETFGPYQSNLPQISLTVKLQVTTTANTVYTLDGNGGAIYADANSNSIFQITATALKQSFSAASGGWNLHGGPGQNQFQLIGPGTFNLNMLVYPQNLGTIEATEGQRAYGTIAATRQGVILRDGDTETLVVNSAAATPGNPNQLGIDIVAGTGTYTITLGAGHDHLQLGSGSATVRLGRPVNQVIGGNGSAAIVGNLLQCSGALIQGNGIGAITLYATVAGTITLNSADQNLTMALKAGSTLNMGAGSGIIADARAGNNVINLQATAQTAIGGNLSTLNGAAAGGDTFEFYKFCGIDTVNGFVASGTGHDMLAISTKAFADYAHLLGATKQVGNDLLITIDAADQITLKNVALASLTSADVRFF